MYGVNAEVLVKWILHILVSLHVDPYSSGQREVVQLRDVVQIVVARPSIRGRSQDVEGDICLRIRQAGMRSNAL